jgi:L-amino acid N-acyltransferase YncA
VGGEIQIRPAQLADAGAIAAIYAPQVMHGTASFEVEEPSVEEMGRRGAEIAQANLPYFVAEMEGAVAGYAYASRFRARSAYRFTVEDSVYVAERFQRRGIARALLERLVEACSASDIREMIAVIGEPSVNSASVALHGSLGFEDAGLLRGVGFKHGRPLDVLLMQRSLVLPR